MMSKATFPKPPDGGWGWVVVCSCFMVTACTRAITRCIPIFFVEFQQHFSKDTSTTAWINSIMDCTTMLCAPIGSLLSTRFGCRATVMFGGLVSSSGFIIASFSPTIEFLYLFLGLMAGLGFALCYSPSIAIVSRYFQRHRLLATGLAMSGNGVGTFVLAPVVQGAAADRGVRLAGSAAAAGGLCGTAVRVRSPAQAPGLAGRPHRQARPARQAAGRDSDASRPLQAAHAVRGGDGGGAARVPRGPGVQARAARAVPVRVPAGLRVHHAARLPRAVCAQRGDAREAGGLPDLPPRRDGHRRHRDVQLAHRPRVPSVAASALLLRGGRPVRRVRPRPPRHAQLLAARRLRRPLRLLQRRVHPAHPRARGRPGGAGERQHSHRPNLRHACAALPPRPTHSRLAGGLDGRL
ncbi:uncharacterized protein LOC144717696 isoform X3 [Lampetra planeri]